MLVLRWRGEGEEAVERVARGCSDRLMRALDPSIALLGPSPAPLARLRGAYRWQALLRAESARALRDAAREAWDEMSQLAQRHGVIFTVNVDPLTMM